MSGSKRDIVICKRCGKSEYWEFMHFYGSVAECRDCYMEKQKLSNQVLYGWRDFEGERPTNDEYEAQEENDLD